MKYLRRGKSGKIDKDAASYRRENHSQILKQRLLQLLSDPHIKTCANKHNSDSKTHPISLTGSTRQIPRSTMSSFEKEGQRLFLPMPQLGTVYTPLIRDPYRVKGLVRHIILRREDHRTTKETEGPTDACPQTADPTCFHCSQPIEDDRRREKRGEKHHLVELTPPPKRSQALHTPLDRLKRLEETSPPHVTTGEEP